MSNQEYDDTNRGVLFRPQDEDATYSLEGRVNVNGMDIDIKLFKRNTPNNKVYWDIVTDAYFFMAGQIETNIYQRLGKVFRSSSDNEKAPVITGNLFANGVAKRFAAWEGQTKAGGKYYQIKLEDPQPRDDGIGSSNTGGYTQPNRNIDDDIPF